MNLAELSIREAGRMLREGSITSQDLVRDSLNRIAASDGSIHAFVRLEADAALMAAQEADRELHGGVDRGASARDPLRIERHLRCPRIAHDVRFKGLRR